MGLVVRRGYIYGENIARRWRREHAETSSDSLGAGVLPTGKFVSPALFSVFLRGKSTDSRAATPGVDDGKPEKKKSISFPGKRSTKHYDRLAGLCQHQLSGKE